MEQFDTGLTMSEKSTMVAHLVLSSKVVTNCIEKLDPDLFNHPNEEAYRLTWSAAKHYYQTYNQLITMEILYNYLISWIYNSPEYAACWPQAEQLFYYIQNMSQNPGSLAPDFVLQEYVQKFLDQRVVRPVLAASSVMDTDDVVKTLTQSYDNSRITSATSLRVFDTENPNLSKVLPKSQPTGCALFDSLIGGIRPNHVAGVLAPFGGGKTMLGIELAVKVAMQRKHAYLFSYEQSIEANLQYRIWSAATGIPTGVFTSTLVKDLPEHVRDKVNEYSYLDEYLHVYDMTVPPAGGGGVEEINAVITNNKSQGINPELVIIDWLGVVVQRYCLAHNLNYDQHKYGTFNTTLGGFRFKIANAHNCQVVISHQLNTEGGKIKPGQRPSMYMAADYGKFAELMDTCILICKADDNGMCMVFNDKNRGDTSTVYAQHHGSLCRFDIADGEMTTVYNTQTGGYELISAREGGGYE